jgi:very-short-patch-repair endonuclease
MHRRTFGTGPFTHRRVVPWSPLKPLDLVPAKTAGNIMSSSKYSRSHQALVVQHAASIRSAPTASEAALWAPLRGGQLGVGFRRQVVVGLFVADFAAASAKLVVEVDGSAHARRAGADARRDRAFVRLGWRVVRVPAELVVRQPLAAVALVRQALAR